MLIRCTEDVMEGYHINITIGNTYEAEYYSEDDEVYFIKDDYGNGIECDCRMFEVVILTKVRCIDNNDGCFHITIGKSYEVLLEDGPYYKVKNDEGTKATYLKSRFEAEDEPHKKHNISPKDNIFDSFNT